MGDWIEQIDTNVWRIHIAGETNSRLVNLHGHWPVCDGQDCAGYCRHILLAMESGGYDDTDEPAPLEWRKSQ